MDGSGHRGSVNRLSKGEVPVGAVVVRDGKVLGSDTICVRFARINGTCRADCLQQASQALNSWRLTGATIYVTLDMSDVCGGDRSGPVSPLGIWGSRSE